MTQGVSLRERGVAASAAAEGGEAGGVRPDLQLDVKAAKLLETERRLQEASERACHLERRLRRAEGGPKREKRKVRAVAASSPEAVQTGEAATAADDPYAYDYYEGAYGYGAESVHTPLSRTLGPTAKRSSSTSTTGSTGTRPRANAASRQRSASVGRRGGSAASRPRAATSVGNIERTVSTESRCSEINVLRQATCAAEASQCDAADGEDEYYVYDYVYEPAVT